MMEALLRRLARQKRVRGAAWISLASDGPARVRLGSGATLEHVRLAPDAMRRYGVAKARVWDAVHGIPGGDALDSARAEDGLALLADAFAQRAHALHAEDPFDAFYVHDFQLLPLAPRLPAGVPRVLRWHIPVVDAWSAPLARLVRRHLERYDAVVVSTQAYAQRLRALGVETPVHAACPYLDASRHRVVSAEDLASFDARWDLAPDEPVFVLVARLDPMKSQDVAIRALARVPRGKLLLVGGGGFSAGKRGGLGLPFADRWRARLDALARERGVADRVVFTGTVPDAELDVAYQRALAVLLPSRLEGFGLAVVEGWLHGRPALVSRGAGVAELVTEGEDGFVHEPGDDEALARAMRRLLDEPDLARELGRRGRRAARACDLDAGAERVWGILRAGMDARAGAADVAEEAAG